MKSFVISLTSLANARNLIRRLVDFWYFLISFSVIILGLLRVGFFTPPREGALFFAGFGDSGFLGAFLSLSLAAYSKHSLAV